MDYVLLILAIVMMIVGIAGCLLPVLPGPPLTYLSLVVLHFTHFADISRNLFIILGIVTILVTVIDYVVPIWGTRQFGGSKYGMRGATVGLIIGLFLGPPGIIIGPFVGAVVGELIYKDEIKYALKAGFGSLLGFLTGIGLKLAASLLMTFYFVRALII
jgi:uncharacterized protein YqgC (DUF456 family)